MPPPVETAQTIVEDALEVAGIIGLGQTPGPEDLNKTFRRLNDMLAQWQRKRWLIWHLVDIPFTSTGAQSYTIGAGQQFNVAQRPDRIESAFIRQVIPSQAQQVDFPVSIIEARETYNQIRLKSLTTLSRYLFYDSAFPIGKLFFVPVPNASIYELHITIKDQLAQFAALVSPASAVPPEYVPAFKWNLARRTRAAYRRPADPEINSLAKDALNTLRLANAQMPLAQMPAALARGGRTYNPYSDQR